MRRFIIHMWLVLTASLFAPTIWAAQSESVDTGKVLAQLVSSHDRVMPGETFHVALKTTLDDHWHTYWRNPGDSGEPVQIDWQLPDSLNAGDIVWPLPAPIATGPIINYGFEGIPYFPIEFTVSADAVIGESLEIAANVYYLVCYDVCIPEQAELRLFVTVGDTQFDTLNKAGIDNALLDAPKQGNATGGLELSGTDVSISVNGLPTDVDLSEAYFFPYDQGYVLHSEPQVVSVGSEGVRLTTQADYLWEDGTPDKLDGVIRYKRGDIWVGEIVSLNVGQAVPIGDVADSTSGAESNGAVSKLNIFTALIWAFFGGLILNLMPCVFPVISMKALSIAKAAHDDVKIIRRKAWFYTFGVIATFLLLTLILLGLKAAGSQIGWGFQLQSPVLVGFLALLLFAIGLNLMGVFEIGSGLQNIGQETTTDDGVKGAFFTGALAVVVATPCTAPFMAGAVGYALAQPALVTLIVFLALAIGFALPFLLIAYVPSLLKVLPKPGLWMVRFKELLSFPMFAAAIWLVWVVTQQTGDIGLIQILSAMLLLALAIWLLKSPKALVKGLAALAIIGALIIPATLKTVTTASAGKAANSVAWSPEAVKAAQAEGKFIFVDFTAAWCVTCKVNERLVLSLPDVKSRLSDDDVVFMIADWTNKNDQIAQELARHGRSGVPLYLIYKPNNNSVTPEILPQVLTQNIVLSALR